MIAVLESKGFHVNYDLGWLQPTFDMNNVAFEITNKDEAEELVQRMNMLIVQ
jgi:hypothetical protein